MTGCGSYNPWTTVVKPYQDALGFIKHLSENTDHKKYAISLHSMLSKDVDVTDPDKRPKYDFKYQIYSLGLLLFEIGRWNTIGKAMKSNLL